MRRRMDNYKDEIEYIKSLLEQGRVDTAEKSLKKIIDPSKLSDPTYIETVFTMYLFMGNMSRLFLKHLKVSKVPPRPIDTAYDIGRRFFYALYILNKSGGMRIVEPYLREIVVHRQLENRYLGGIFFFNFNYKQAVNYYQKAFEMLNSPFSEIEHLLILGNLGAAYLYLQDYENYEKTKNIALKISNNDKSVMRVYSKYDILKNLQLGNTEAAVTSFKHIDDFHYRYKREIPKTEMIMFKIIEAFCQKDKNKCQEYLLDFKEVSTTNITKGIISPERYFASSFYYTQISQMDSSVWKDILDFHSTTYPIQEYKILGKQLNDSHFRSMGKPTANNYINFRTQEYVIGDKKGIGLNNEIKAIYYLVRAQHYGLTFETLASLIYKYEDYSGLFMIKERVKQIIHRLKNHYHISVHSKNFRAYLEDNFIDQIYITKDDPLRIANNFTLQKFMEFYMISQSKAKIQLSRLINELTISKELVGKKNVYTKK